MDGPLQVVLDRIIWLEQIYRIDGSLAAIPSKSDLLQAPSCRTTVVNDSKEALMASDTRNPDSDDPRRSIEPIWLHWARQLQSLAQTGLTFATDPYDSERYQEAHALALDMLAAIGKVETATVAALFENEAGYATPKVDVRGAVFRDNRILLVREVTDGKWALPGGWADVNLSPSENIEKEIVEESGYLAKVSKLAAVYDRLKHPHEPPHPFHIYKMFFICDLIGGSAQASIETSEVGFYEETGLPELSRGRVLESQIHRMFEHWRDPTLPTDFD